MLVSFLRASTHAYKRFTLVTVCPSVFEYMSFIPASAITFLHSFSTIRPVPFGAGINFILIEPHLPSTANGIECDSPQKHSHEPQPLLTLTMFSFADLVAFSLAGIVSFALPIPIPTYPFLLPTTAIVANDGLFPSLLFFWVCLQIVLLPPPNLPFDCPIINKSVSSFFNRKSTISGSIIFSPLSSITARLAISPAFTFFPVSVFGVQLSGLNSFSLLTPEKSSSL